MVLYVFIKEWIVNDKYISVKYSLFNNNNVIQNLFGKF